MMKRTLLVAGAAVVALSCLAPDVEIVTSLGSGGFGGIGNVGGALGSGGTSNPVTCPPTLPTQISQFPCTQEGLTCDYGNTHCVCRQFLLECSTSGSGGSAGASSGGAAGSAGASAGTGGMSGNAGSGGSSAGSGGAPAACIEAVSDIFSGGAYFQNGDWHGYAYTMTNGVGNEIEPPNFAGWAPASAPCACGSVAVGEGSTAGIGINISQAVDGQSMNGALVTGTGLQYAVVGQTAGLRITLQGELPSQQWCIDAFGIQEGTIAWTNFQTECWMGGVPLDPSADRVVAVNFQFPSGTSPVDFEFCVTYLAAAP